MSDPIKLFRNTRSLIKVIWIFSIVMVPVLAGVVVVLLVKPEAVTFSGRLLALDRNAGELAARVGCVLVLVAAIVFVPVMRELLRIIDSAITGDPFVPDNARRLRRIGWLLLTFNILTTEALTVFMKGGLLFPPITLNSLVTVVLVFVLAHIFEHGSRMRAELQETI